MKSDSSILVDLLDGLDKAEKRGPELLQRELSSHPDAVAALLDNDTANNAFDKLYEEYPFLKMLRIDNPKVQQNEMVSWASLLKWLVSELCQWRSKADPKRTMIAACLVVSQASDFREGLWPLISERFIENVELRDGMARMTGGIALHLSAAPDAPMWEREAMERLIEADMEMDWPEMAAAWHPFEHMFFTNFLHKQAIRCLLCFGMEALIVSCVKTQKTTTALQIAGALSTTQQLELGVASGNRFIEFACLYQFIGSKSSPTSKEEQLLVDLFLIASRDNINWRGWMGVFNAYPGRYEGIQNALGMALAQVHHTAASAYVSSITLYPLTNAADPNRKCVAECLRAFQLAAAKPRREELWTIAQARWEAWDFDRSGLMGKIFSISHSQLDYAIVAYASECLSDETRAAAADEIVHQLQVLDDGWHVSISDLNSQWNRLLSKFQIYAHASQCQTNPQDCLPMTHQYWPFERAKEPYLTMKYRTL